MAIDYRNGGAGGVRVALTDPMSYILQINSFLPHQNSLLAKVVAVVARNHPVCVVLNAEVDECLVDLRVRVVHRHEALAAEAGERINVACFGHGQWRLPCDEFVEQRRRPIVVWRPG